MGRRNTVKDVSQEGIIGQRTPLVVVGVGDITGVIDIVGILQSILPIVMTILRVRMTNQMMNTGVMTGGDGNTRNENGEELLVPRDTIVTLRVETVATMYLLARRHSFRTWKRPRN